MTIYCVNLKEYIPFFGAESLLNLFKRIQIRLPGLNPICARVNNKTEALSFPLFAPKQVEFIDANTPTGRSVYIRSLCMMLYKAVNELFPNATLTIDHSMSKGYLCRLLDAKSRIPIEVNLLMCSQIKDKLLDIYNADFEFIRKEKLTSDVIKIFKAQGLERKVLLLETSHELYTTYYELDGLADSYYGPLAPSTAYIPVFDIVLTPGGFLLMGPDQDNPKVPTIPIPQEKMYKAFTDYLKFNRVIRVSSVGQLNLAIKRRETADLINVAEAMHDKLLGRISDKIQQHGARIVLIAGPSSSGKTTSTKRLAIQLMTNLIVPKMISLDDYFVNRENTPRDEHGDYDYESLYALDLDQFNDDLNNLLDGKEVNIPSYSFELGRRTGKKRPLKLEPNEVLLIEGIHGLNPDLTSHIPPHDIFKIYVSALTTLKIDDHNWIPTTDNRLLRRIVRDFKYRHTSALDTIRRWNSVRNGEEKWIFPYQENADATFNSSLIFELGVMKPYAEPLLRNVPHDVPEYGEAYRLLKFLSYFDPIPMDQIPPTSLLREFLGGSSFRY